jgi:hypothetical protein
MCRHCFFVGLFSLAVMITTAAAQETTSPAASGAIGGTGVGVQYNSNDFNPFGSLDSSDEPPLRPIRSTLRTEPLSTEYIEEALDSPLKSPLQYENQPLNEIIATLADEFRIPIVIDMASLEQMAIAADTEVTIDLENLTLRSALNIILRQPELEDVSFAIQDEVLTIASEERCAEWQFVRIYPTEDFVYNNGSIPRGGASAWAEYSPLIKLITDCVSPETWAENGSSDGQIQMIKPGILIVRQEYRVHVEIEKLLTDLRRELKMMEKELGPEAMKETGRFYDRQQSRPANRGRGGRF